MDALPILAEPLYFGQLNRLASGHPPEYFPFHTVKLRWDEPVDGATHHLIGGIAEDLLGTLVPARDSAVELFPNDGICRRGDDGRQPGQRLIGPDPVRHILTHYRQPLDGGIGGYFDPDVPGWVVRGDPRGVLPGGGAAVSMVQWSFPSGR